MNSNIVFIKTVTQEYIHEHHPEEEEFLFAYLQEAEKTNFQPRAGNAQDIPFGFGGSDLLEMFQSPLVVQILSGIWGDLLSPLVLDLIKKQLRTADKEKLGEQALKTLSRKKLRDYIRGKAKKKLLSDEEADDLAERVIDWIRRHPEDIEKITQTVK